jgi:hypothetical protein
MSSQGIMSSKKANDNPGLCPVKIEKSVFVVGLGPEISLSLSLSTAKTMSHYQMLVIHPAFYLSLYILPRDHQRRLMS